MPPGTGDGPDRGIVGEADGAVAIGMDDIDAIGIIGLELGEGGALHRDIIAIAAPAGEAGHDRGIEIATFVQRIGAIGAPGHHVRPIASIR